MRRYNFSVDIPQLKSAIARHFASQRFTEVTDSDRVLDLELANASERWGIALCPDREEGMAYLGTFEAAMQKMMDARQADADTKLGTGIAFGSAAAGQHPSFRRALKKYSNSIVFEDLGLHLFLVQDGGEVVELEPLRVNAFLRDLDPWIARRNNQPTDKPLVAPKRLTRGRLR